MDANHGNNKAGPGRSRGRGRAASVVPSAGGRGRGRRQEILRSGETLAEAVPPPPKAWGPPKKNAGSDSDQSTKSLPTNQHQQQPVLSYSRAAASTSTDGKINNSGAKTSASANTSSDANNSAGAAAAVASTPVKTVRDDARGAVRGKRILTEIVKTRPTTCETKIGKLGAPVLLETNYFVVEKQPRWSIHQYRVDFSPDIDALHLRRAYLAHHKSVIGGYIFDGTVLFSSNYFVDAKKSGVIELLTKNREDETIQIKIKHVAIVNPTEPQHLQVLNLILRRAMEGLQLQLVGRNLFDPRKSIKVENFKLEIWPGYQTSIRQHERDVLLCSEIAHKVMRVESVYQILKDITRDNRDFQDIFKREIVGTIVITDYNNKTYRVNDVDFTLTPKSTFETKDGKISFYEYYKKRYNLVIKDFQQPLLISCPTERNIRGGNDEFIMLVPEFTRATGITDAMRNNFRLMKAMSDHTRLNPDRRIQRLKAFNQSLHQSAASDEVFNSWNFKLGRNLLQVNGRILPSESILFGGNHFHKCDSSADWSREFRNASMSVQKDLTRWVIIVPMKWKRESEEFVVLCFKAAKGMRMRISAPIVELMNEDRNNNYLNAIENATSRDPQMVMIVLPNKNEDKYALVKKKCCVDRPVPSQVVTIPTIAPRNPKANVLSVATKVVIQMNAKILGLPWMINLPLRGLMTVGFDVCHSAKDKNKSFGALVATMDMKSSTSYFSAVNQHLKGQELSNEVSMHMTCALRAYMKEHKTLPERVLFYRDGVGDGQLHQVISNEVKHLKAKLDEIYKSAGTAGPCRFAFVIVSKRINTRFFYNAQNPVPGTIVDDVVTLPERYDFFLVSQSVRQGTVSPTSYNVIFDTMGLDVDKVQMLTYKMTHMYFNWAGTCRVPAVCQYAHKLAFLVAESIGRAPSSILENKLYFL